MLIVARDRSYPELLSSVDGKRIHIWTCNTCARLCGKIGGKDSANILMNKLKANGIDVIGVSYVSASCIMPIVESKRNEIPNEEITILALTCNIGAKCVKDAFNKKVLNPIKTLGPGYIDSSGKAILFNSAENISEMSQF
ncbi:MAG: hypothetical protein MJY54_02270 [archaeon]|nr:hypothetical protein [archaeon]